MQGHLNQRENLRIVGEAVDPQSISEIKKKEDLEKLESLDNKYTPGSENQTETPKEIIPIEQQALKIKNPFKGE